MTTLHEFKQLLARKPTARVVVLSAGDRDELIDELEALNFTRTGFVLNRAKQVFVNGVLVKDEVNS